VTISELKTLNLQRLCRERHLNATALGKLLDASKSHGSQLLRGISVVGGETIRKLCAAWMIDETEFILMGGDMKMEGMQKQIDDLRRDMNKFTAPAYFSRRLGRVIGKRGNVIYL